MKEDTIEVKNGHQQFVREIDWPTTLFLLVTPVLALVLVPVYFIYFEFHWPTLVLGYLFWVLSSLSITACYHRLYAHRSFEARAWFKAFMLFFGAGAFQGPALKWCSEHRRHHRQVDTNDDPYCILKGFWFAHMTWLFVEQEPRFRNKFAPDLLKDRWVRFQHRYYLPLSLFSGFGLPTLIGALYGDAVGGFIIGGVLRVVIGHHTTFFINSLCHMWGRQTYSDKVTARDNHWLALVTNGEGYHNFHHTFEGDYRNGVRWYHWDPTKWVIRGLSMIGQTYRLNRVSPHLILKSRLQMQQQQLVRRGFCEEKIKMMRTQVEKTQARVRELKAEYKVLKKSLKKASSERLEQMRREMTAARREWKQSWRQWSALLSGVRPPSQL